MNLFAHHAGAALAGRDMPLDFAHARLVALSALLWLAAIGVAVIITLVVAVPSQSANEGSGSTEPATPFGHGA